jgi:hypothetical protein
VSVVAPFLDQRLDSLLAAGLSVDARARLVAEGAALRDEDAFKLAFDDYRLRPTPDTAKIETGNTFIRS